MGKSPCCSKVGLREGPWSAKEDMLLVNYIQAHGAANWRSLPEKAGLQRCGKSCRLRWINYLCPGIKRGNITPDEEDLIIRLHSLLGNRWSLIAGRLPGRTDNEIKNYWNTHLVKKLKNAGIEPKSSSTKKKPKSSNKNATKTPKESQNKAAVCADQSNNASMKNNSEAAAKIKVYVPKPIRLTRGFTSYNCIDSSSLSPSSHEEANKEAIVDEETKAEEVSHFAWPFIELGDANYNGGIHVGEDDQLLIEDCNFSLEDSVPTINDNILEKVYAEYLQPI